MFAAETFSAYEGRYVPLEDTIADFEAIADGEADNLPEQAFYMVGNLNEAREKAAAGGGES